MKTLGTAELLGALDREGRLLAEAAEAAGTDARVPPCPGWRVRDLLRHTGVVHRWATAFVADAHVSPRPMGDPPDLDGTDLLAWYRAGHRRLVDTLTAAPDDVRCWTFHRAPVASPLAFWVRRQAHETAVHRFDAEAARGGEATAVDAGFAVDGIDELLRGFHARSRSKVRTPEPRVLRVRATAEDGPGDDTGGATLAVWTIRLSQDPPVTVLDASEDADAELAGAAARLYLALWNRVPVPAVTGDASLAALWRNTSAIV